MDWRRRSTHTSRALSGDTLVRLHSTTNSNILIPFPDVLVHRQLSSAIGYTSLHPTLHAKEFVDGVVENINKRHRQAQMAGRASVEFFVGLALKKREEALGGGNKGEEGVVEEAFVIRVWRNGVGVFVSK
jgi:exosome complex exonuclease DIS3/RRP44